MRGSGKGGRYHHGDLRAALIDTAIELISERGVRGFSLAEASRRLGVAVSAPYAHFADRDELLAAVAVHACQVFAAELGPRPDLAREPAAQLAAMTAAYVRFAARRRPLFEVVFEAGLDKARHPEVEAAEAPINEAFLAGAGPLAGGPADARDLAIAIESSAHGHAMLLLDGTFGPPPEAVDVAAARAARATLALIESRHLIRDQEPAPAR